MGLVTHSLRLALGILFAVSASGKWRDLNAFAHGVREYRLVPDGTAGVAAASIVVVESVAAISHLSGYGTQVTVPLAWMMLVIFTVAISINLRRGKTQPCYCFGGNDSETLSTVTLLRAGACLIGESILLWRLEVVPGGDASTTGFMQVSQALIGALLVLTTMRWLLAIPDVIEMRVFSPLHATLRDRQAE